MTDDIDSITTLVITDKLQRMHSVEAVICSIHSLVNISRMRYVSNPKPCICTRAICIFIGRGSSVNIKQYACLACMSFFCYAVTRSEFFFIWGKNY
jgi:hypothetical protein